MTFPGMKWKKVSHSDFEYEPEGPESRRKLPGRSWKKEKGVHREWMQGQQTNALWTDDWDTGKGLFYMKIMVS